MTTQTRHDLCCLVFRPKDRELYYMCACSTTVFLLLLTGYDDYATHYVAIDMIIGILQPTKARDNSFSSEKTPGGLVSAS